MLKKVMLGIVAVIVLVGAENLIAQEREVDERAEKRALRRAERAEREAGHKRMEGVQQKRQGFRPVQERFDRWFDKLTKAYRQNDREKMGQLLRKMHQFREGQTKAKDAVGERRQDFCGGARARKREAGQFCGGLGGRGQGIQGRGMGGQGQDFQARGMGRRDQGLQHTGMGRPDPDMPPRGMGRRQQRTHGGGRGYRNPGFPRRGMRNRRQDRHSSEWDW